MTPAAYARHHTTWKKYIGKSGVIVAATRVMVSSPELTPFTPYAYVIVDLGKEKISCMGVGNQELSVGDHVECVLRKIASPDSQGVIPYGIRVRKV